ncbi:MAG TPA: DUF1707 domain-containing protein [Jiangellaceae bacterium]|jgi:hypothetical protein|nr:DUF1707 domain-containing protein [Jiangellaceae bacterium]
MAPALRIGDAEREHAAAALGEHYATGRLSKQEYEERAEQVWAARFQTDLEPLFADLPSPWAPARTEVRPVRARPAARARRPAPPFAPVAPLLVIGLVTVAILTGMPWLLFGLFWLCALAGGGPGRARQYRARQATVGGIPPWRS